MTQDNHDQMIRTSAGLVPGLIVAGLGVLFLLSNLNVLHIYNWWQLWPVVVIAIGVTKLVDAPAHHEKASGAVMVLVGAAFLAMTFGWVSWRIWELWPLALIGAGAVMLVHRIGQFEDRSGWTVAQAETRADGIAVFSGFKRRITGEYRGADYTAVFGGGEIDLRQAHIEADVAVATVTAIFGGIEFKVPEGWMVINEVVGIFGGTEDKTVQPSPDTPGLKRMIIRGAAIFGGVSIKN